MNNLERKYQFAGKIFIVHKNDLKVDLWQMSNGKKSLDLACCITGNDMLQ